MWVTFISAVGLLLVFEGILPFLSPPAFRHIMQRVILQSDKGIRMMGLISMLIGLLVVSIARDL